MSTTTTLSSVIPGALRDAVEATEPLGTLGMEALSEVARSATVAQNLAGSLRLEAAHFLIESIRRIDADPDSGGGSGRAPRPAHARLNPADQARDYLCAALALTCWHAARLVTAATQVHTRLPRLRSALARGLFPEQLAIETACSLAEVPEAILPGVEAEVVDALARALDGGHRPSRDAVRTMIDAAIERRDPSAANDAAADATDKRTVRFRPARNGMTSMWAHLPSGSAEKLRRRIDAAARSATDAGHPRTRDQLRADALTALGDPTTDDIGSPLGGYDHDDDRDHDHAEPTTTNGSGGRSAGGQDGGQPDAGTASGSAAGTAWGTDKPIRISIINGIAQGLPNRVQFVTGAYASLDWLCEELLNSTGAKVRFEVIDPTPGTLDSPDAALKYFINPALAERIRLRDGTCRHPGCTVDAHDCDLDHVIAFDRHRPELGGPTAEWNLMSMCRSHHREKTFGRNAYRPGPLGELIIFTETGHEHRTTPNGPLAHARTQILERQWRQHLDRIIDYDNHLTNPPGSHRQ